MRAIGKRFLIALVILFVVGVFLRIDNKAEKKEYPEIQETKENTDLEKSQNRDRVGTVTIYDDESGEVYFQYYGEMKLIEDEEFEVEVHLPTTHCSCFDAEGNLLE